MARYSEAAQLLITSEAAIDSVAAPLPKALLKDYLKMLQIDIKAGWIEPITKALFLESSVAKLGLAGSCPAQATDVLRTPGHEMYVNAFVKILGNTARKSAGQNTKSIFELHADIEKVAAEKVSAEAAAERNAAQIRHETSTEEGCGLPATISSTNVASTEGQSESSQHTESNETIQVGDIVLTHSKVHKQFWNEFMGEVVQVHGATNISVSVRMMEGPAVGDPERETHKFKLENVSFLNREQKRPLAAVAGTEASKTKKAKKESDVKDAEEKRKKEKEEARSMFGALAEDSDE